MDVSLVCRLDDNQSFYGKVFKKHTKLQANRLIAMLHLLKGEGSSMAGILLPKLQNIEAVANLVFQYRELDALIYAMRLASAQSDANRLSELLQQLFLIIAPVVPEFANVNLLNQMEILGSNQIVHSPLLATSVIVERNTEPIEFVRHLQDYTHHKKESAFLSFRDDVFTHGGIRVTVACQQPSAAGQEFQTIESGNLPTKISQQWICDLLDMLTLLDINLSANLAQLMKLYTVVPRTPEMRQAGSVSSVPGWAWQDIDPEEDKQEELCHLCVQMVHEFFHTKLYLVESNIPLYDGDGNSPQLFSPWKGRNRPLRQVIHALMTFSAGAAIWVKLLQSSIINRDDVLALGVGYCRENVEFAKMAHNTLRESKALTPNGEILVDACFENLLGVTKSLI